jgi:glycosyltransferase involved in cell wall biosynthesis
MRILQVVTRSDSGGAQSIVLSLSESLCEYGHTVFIASGPEGAGEAWRGLDPRVSCVEVRHLVRAISPPDDLVAMMELTSLYRRVRPDIVHLHTSKAGAIGRMAPGMDRGRIVYTMHGYDQLRVANRRFLKVDMALKGRCGAIAAVSEADLIAMSEDGYSPRLVPNGTKDTRGLPLEDEKVLRRISELRAKYPVLALLVARDARPKRIDLAREVAARLDGEVGILWIGGETKAGDPPGFHALGAARNAGAYIGLCDMFLLLSDHEGLSVSMLEAFSSGVATVASAVPGCLEALGLGAAGQGRRGMAVDNDVGKICRAIRLLTVDGELRRKMGLAARAAWEEKYSNGAMTRNYLAIYEKLLEGRARGEAQLRGRSNGHLQAR